MLALPAKQRPPLRKVPNLVALLPLSNLERFNQAQFRFFVLLDHWSNIRDIRKRHALEDGDQFQQLGVIRVAIPWFYSNAVLRQRLPFLVAFLVHNHRVRKVAVQRLEGLDPVAAL